MSTPSSHTAYSPKISALMPHHLLPWVKRARKIGHIFIISVLSLAILSIVAQLLYPVNRALPFTKVGGQVVGGKDLNAIVSQLDEYALKGETTVKTPSREWKAKWQAIGLGVDREASAEAAVQYETWERLLPFSSVMRIVNSQTTPLIALIDEDRLRAFAEQLVNEDKQAAREATVHITDGQVKVDEAKNGYKFTVTEVERQVRTLPLGTDMTLTLVPEPVSAIHSSEEIQAIATQLERMLNTAMTLQVGDKTYKPSRTHIGEWLQVTEYSTTKKLVITFKADVAHKYVESINAETTRPPGLSTVTLLDGIEIGRTPAANGQSIAIDQALKNIESRLRAADSSVLPLQVVNVPPLVNYVRNYSQASSGLQALLQHWESGVYGDYGVIIRELGGQSRYAEWQPDKRFVTASTFKMFLAYVVLTKIHQGQISGSQQTDMGWTVDDCITEMIVNSTNQCAISLQNLVGLGEVDNMLHAAGFTATTLNNGGGGDKYSSVRDEANFLVRLQASSLMDGASTDRLLGLMKRQIWRGGIPSGVPRGTVVADKVGFYNGWRHDVAIVYGPKSIYILAIMSRGGSDANFANLSRQVYDFFNR